jgi:hypothetical protein
MPLVSRTFDQLINFTRTSAATFVGSNGLVQTTPASVNILTFTQELDNAAWTKTSVTITANSTVAPDGTSTADTVTATAAASSHIVFVAATNLAGATQWSASIYAKAGTHGFMQILHSSNPDYFANFNLTTGVVGTKGVGVPTSTITPVGDGWYRCSMTFTPAAAGTLRFGVVSSASAVYNESWTPAGTETFFLWGAQAEIAAAPTTYTRNFGGVFPPRFDYDPVSLAPRGLLIEAQRTNLFTYSADFTNVVWGKTNITVTAAAAVSPDGTSNAQKIEATASAATVFTSSATAVAATSATFSVYVKQGTGATTANTFILRNSTASTNLIAGTLDYSTGVWTYSTGSTGVVVTNAGNGWWRVQIAASSGITSGDNLVGYIGFAGGVQTAGNHLFAWGAQLEAGPAVTSYIPTVASQVTRTSDQPTIAAPNFASWYNSSEGTLVVEFDVVGFNSVSEVVAAISDSTSSNLFLAFVNSGGSTFVNTISGGVTSANVNAGAIATNTTVKLATVYRVNDFAASQNGAVPTVDTSGAVPVGANRLDLGWAAPYGGLFLNGHLRRLYFYPTRLTNAQLQALST